MLGSNNRYIIIYLTPLNDCTGWISSGKFSVSGHKKLSIIGMILHCESNAATISYIEMTKIILPFNDYLRLVVL